MKVINFSAVEILPALLSHEKTQTIRPLPTSISHVGGLKWRIQRVNTTSRYKVGDIVQLMWKQRTSPKDSWFCSNCGNIYHTHTIESNGTHNAVCPICIGEFQPIRAFPKILGTVKLTEIFQIEMGKEQHEIGSYCYWIKINGHQHTFTRELLEDASDVVKFHTDVYGLVKRDGFKSAEDMFKWFDKKYNLSVPKKFEVRRWKYVS